MRTRTLLASAFAIAAGLAFAAIPARAQDTGAAGGAATRSPSTSPNDVPPATNRGIIGNEIPGRGVVPGGGVIPGPGTALPTTGPGIMAGRPGAGFVVPPNATFDQLFAAAATSADNAELAMACLALQRGSSDEVKLFAQRVLADHTKASAELINLATTKAMGVPMSLELRDRAEEAILRGLTGEEFDKAFVHQQLAAHMGAVALFKAEAQRGQDPQLRAFAARMLPTLEDHRNQAKRIHDEMDSRPARPATPRR
jgi:putative membrane protein